VSLSAADAFARFREVVVRDEALCETLDAETDPHAFAALAQRLGAERGFSFTVEDVERAIDEGRRAWLER
jgi:hypothetical protein